MSARELVLSESLKLDWLLETGLILTQAEVNVKQTLSAERKEIFYLTTHLAHFIYGYKASDIIW